MLQACNAHHRPPCFLPSHRHSTSIPECRRVEFQDVDTLMHLLRNCRQLEAFVLKRVDPNIDLSVLFNPPPHPRSSCGMSSLERTSDDSSSANVTNSFPNLAAPASLTDDSIPTFRQRSMSLPSSISFLSDADKSSTGIVSGIVAGCNMMVAR